MVLQPLAIDLCDFGGHTDGHEQGNDGPVARADTFRQFGTRICQENPAIGA